MKITNLLAALFLMDAGVQTADAQGFRVYKSDGTVAQFSLRTDSIVFYDGIGTDVDFGPFTPVNLCIAKTWYKSKTETVTFNANGTTDYMERATYKFFPYQGNLVFYSTSGVPMNILRVYEVTAERMIVGTLNGSNIMIWSTTVPPQYVTSIVLNETSVTLNVDATKTLTATVLPEDAENKVVVWESSNVAVAEVNNNGRVIANADGTCTITCCATDGSGVKAECQVRVKTDHSGTLNGRDYVDLNLPSGTLWATCNVGTSSPEEYGDYFAWGETESKSEYNYNTYKYCNRNGLSYMVTKYCTSSSYGTVDNKTELEPVDDAATTNWGSGWQMPNLEQFEELINSNYTTTTWTAQDGVNGRKITSKSNGNSIFLPAAGSRSETSLSSGPGRYWSRSLNPDNSDNGRFLYFSLDNISTSSYGFRGSGLSVRPVRVK